MDLEEIYQNINSWIDIVLICGQSFGELPLSLWTQIWVDSVKVCFHHGHCPLPSAQRQFST